MFDKSYKLGTQIKVWSETPLGVGGFCNYRALSSFSTPAKFLFDFTSI